MTRCLLIFLVLLAGCSTPDASEGTREVALKYINADVGTTGPFSKRNPKDLEILSPSDRAQASALLDRGAVGFVIYAGSRSTDAGAETCVVLVQNAKVVGDFRAAPK
ncbi:MAG: hypothetical protein H7343_14470 [Undibacterium sp.]|nr:hypothetical protein [Opitutaceae bacterium]